MKLSDKIVGKPEVISRLVGDEVVLLDLAKGTYFGLDPVGSRIWQLAESGKSLSEICDALLLEYDVAREQLECDTLALASELIAKNLARIAGEEAHGA